jgi:hypothetical protein
MSQRKPRAREQKARTAADERSEADLLARAHATMRLWCTCKNTACRRRRGCSGAIDECGTRCAPKAWAWVRHAVHAFRNGASRQAAVRAANGTLQAERIIWKFKFGNPREVVWRKKEDGTYQVLTGSEPPLPWELQLRRLRRGRATWLRAGEERARARCYRSR